MEILEYILTNYKHKIGRSSGEIYDMGRDDLARVFGKFGFNRGVEIGTEKGKYTSILLKENPKLKLYTIDPYKYYEDGEGYRNDMDDLAHERNYQQALTRLDSYAGRVEILRMTSMEAVKRFDDNSIQFCYIDGNHRLDYVTQDLVCWTKKVKPGGVVAGHDYIRHARNVNSHVPYALGAYCVSYFIDKYYVLDQKQPNLSDEENKKRDRIRSWFFVKK